MPDYDQAHIERVARVKRAATARLLAIPGVHLVALGSKETRGQPTGELAIRVHVDGKRPAADIPPDELIPAEIDGVRTDVLGGDSIVPLVGPAPPGALNRDIRFRREEKRPVVGGTAQVTVATGVKGSVPETNDGGTLGCLLSEVGSPDRGYALTCQHVIDSNKRLRVKKGETEVGSPVGNDSSTCCNDIIGRYLDGELVTEQVAIGGGRTVKAGTSDEAVVRLSPGMKWKAEILEIGAVPPIPPITDAELIMAAVAQSPVRKRGMRTGLTGGTISDASAAVAADGAFDNRIVITPNGNPDRSGQEPLYFAEEGDSGAALVDADNRVIGIVTARSARPSRDGIVFAFALPIGHVLTRLNALLASQTPPVVLEVATANVGDPPHTVPGAVASVAVPPELIDRIAAEPEAFLGSSAGGGLRAPVGRPWFAVSPRSTEVLAELRQALDRTETGRLAGELWARHGRELRDLVSHDRPVTIAWHRGGGAALFQLLLRMLTRPELALPETLNGVPVAACLDRLAATLVQRGSPGLATDVERIRAVLPDLGGRTLPEIMVALGAAPVPVAGDA